MNNKTNHNIRIGITVFTLVIMGIAVRLENTLLAVAGVLTGIAFLVISRSQTGKQIDEREKMVREKAAQMAYAIFAPTIGIGAIFLILLARGDFYFLEAIGIVLAYLSMFLIALYAISHYYLNRKFGGDGEK
jgi:uncharacterized membrane protein